MSAEAIILGEVVQRLSSLESLAADLTMEVRALRSERGFYSNHVRELVRVEANRGKATDLITAIAAAFRVSESALLGDSREEEIVDGRHAAMRLLREEYHLSHSEIGRRLKKDHVTVATALSRFDARLQGRPECRRKYELVRRVLDMAKAS